MGGNMMGRGGPPGMRGPPPGMGKNSAVKSLLPYFFDKYCKKIRKNDTHIK